MQFKLILYIGKCSFCSEIKYIYIISIFEFSEDYFCSKDCRDRYFKQYDRGLKV